MKAIGPQPSEVVIIRAGYASLSQWLHAIRTALQYGRYVRAIDGAGAVTVLRPWDPAPGEDPER